MAHPFIPFTNTVKLELIHNQYAQYMENVLYFRKTLGAPTLEDQESLAADVVSWWNTNMKPLVSDDCNLVKVRTKDMTTQTGMGLEYVTGLPLTGSSGNTGAPSNVTLAIKWSSQLSGRSYRGRSFQIGLQAARISNDVVDSDYCVNLQAAWQQLITDMGSQWELVIASSMHNKTWRTIGNLIPAVTASVDRYVDSQRRRLVGRGR